MTICKHKWLDVPAWCTPDSLKVAKALMGDDETTFARENLGLVVDGGKNVFTGKLITRMFRERPPITLTRPVPFVFVCVDPQAGSMKPENSVSDFAIVSYVCDPRVIVGLDAFPCNSHTEYIPRVLEHIARLQKHEYMKHSLFVIDVEANSDNTSASLIYEEAAKRFKNITIGYCSHPHTDKIGSSIQEREKGAMVNVTQQYINSQSIHLMENYVTTDPKQVRHTTPESKDANELYEQCLRLERIVNISKNGVVSSHIRYSGKIGSKKDDLVITFMRAVYTAKRFFEQQYYSKYWLSRGNPYIYDDTEEEDVEVEEAGGKST